ncbi:hypothetical protein SAMN02927923_04537 [Microvirga guangxiensis]|uniref:Uncharacterized protein n=1 Tax=Microvirga guangxiensis TaxID=549386 RepID=A0A1G5LN21_9HYPH|nr:hypothetical protein SAMN02927923_04537 [Microvirga guangxiensis]
MNASCVSFTPASIAREEIGVCIDDNSRVAFSQILPDCYRCEPFGQQVRSEQRSGLGPTTSLF